MLFLKVIDTQRFISLKGLQPIKQNVQCSHSIPMQFRSLSEKAVITQITSSIQTITLSVVITTITLSFFLTLFLQQLWGMINTMQISTHVSLLSINLPPNILDFLSSLFNIVTFNFIDVPSYLQYIFFLSNPSAYPQYNESFNFLGYNGSNWLYNIGMPIFIIISYFGFIVIYLLLKIIS